MRFRKTIKTLASLLLAAIITLGAACSSQGDKTPYFQNNNGSNPITGGEDPFSGFTDLGDTAVLETPVALLGEIFNPGSFNLDITSTSYQNFADNMEYIRVNNQTSIDNVLYKVRDLADDEADHGLYGLMERTGNILNYIIHQSEYDSPNDDHETYTAELYSYLNKINTANLDIKGDIYDILFRSLGYIQYTYNPTPAPDYDVNDAMIDINSFLSDSSGQTFGTLLVDFQEGMGKILMRADTNIRYDDGSGSRDIELGNAVAGVDLLFKAINDVVSHDEQARGYVYDILRETGKLLNGTTSSGSKDSKTVLKEFLVNTEDYFTTGGASFGSNYNNGSNPYVNAELGNTIKEMWPTLAKLFIRERDGSEHPDYAMIKTGSESMKGSPVELLTRALYQLKRVGIDYSLTDYALEPTLKRMTEYNAYGQTRDGSNYRVSALDHLVYTIGVAYNFGYLTRNTSSGEPYGNSFSDSGSWGHARATNGCITVNDSMYNLTTKETFGLDSYGLALAHRLSQGPRVGRSSSYFSNGQLASKGFYMGFDYPTLLLLPSNCAGDAGIPNGGDRAITPSSNDTTVSVPGSVSNNDYRTYYPKVADGKGILNTAHFMMGWIARACWDGQGPYYATAGGTGPMTETWPPTGESRDNVYKYKKPNGDEYAWVHKPDGTPSHWEYYYPATGNDAVDPDDTATPKQRINRYKDIVKSDYYLIRQGDNSDNYCAPPMNPNGQRYINSSGKYDLDSEGLCTHYNWLGICTSRDLHNSSYFQLYERVMEKSSSRECVTQEEAIFRNFQWLMLEKKFVFIIPMNINTTVCWIDIKSAAFIVIEGNGLLGLANAKKGTANGRWALLNSEGNWRQTRNEDKTVYGTVRNDPDYGDSSYLGDGRIVVLVNPAGAGALNADSIFGDVLGSGYVLPDIVGRNIHPAVNMAFPLQDNTGNSQNCIPSNSSVIGNTGSSTWQKRSSLFPVLLALIGTMMDGTRYEASTGGNNYNYDGNHKYPLAEILEGLMIPLGKPMLRYWNDSEAFGGSTSTGRWVPRMADEGFSGSFDYFNPVVKNSASVEDYRPPTNIRTLVSFLAGNSDNTIDGLVPLIADNTRIVTTLVALLQHMGNDDPGSMYREDRMAILQNLSVGLEQIVTGMQVARGQNITAAGRSMIDNARYGWMFTDVDDRRNGSPVSVDLNSALSELIGDNTKGLSKFVDDRGNTPTAGGWANYDRLFDALAVMLGDRSSSYYILDDSSNGGTAGIIGVMNKMLTRVAADDDDLKALRHTLGILMARYEGGTWRPHNDGSEASLNHSDVYKILHQYVPDMLTAYNSSAPTGRYGDLVLALTLLFDYNNNGVMDPENVNYLLDLLVPWSDAEGIITGTYGLVSRDALTDPAYYSPMYPNHSTWKELADICETLADRE